MHQLCFLLTTFEIVYKCTYRLVIEEGAFVLAGDIQDEKGANLEARFKDSVLGVDRDAAVDLGAAAIREAVSRASASGFATGHGPTPIPAPAPVPAP